MQFFSDEYLMHYGIKGMKWKKKKKGEFRTPESYYEEAYNDAANWVKKPNDKRFLKDLNRTDARGDSARHRSNTLRRIRRSYAKAKPGDYNYNGNNFITAHTEHKTRKLADERRNADLKKARKKAYKKNQRRIARQQKRAKVKNAIKNFVNPPLKVEHHTYLGR